MGAMALCTKYNMPWPPMQCAITGSPAPRNGMVQRLRGNVNSVAGVGVDSTSTAGYSGHQAPLDVLEEGDEYADDFEDASGSEASYDADFEALSDADTDDGEDCTPQAPTEELSEAQVR